MSSWLIHKKSAISVKEVTIRKELTK